MSCQLPLPRVPRSCRAYQRPLCPVRSDPTTVSSEAKLLLRPRCSLRSRPHPPSSTFPACRRRSRAPGQGSLRDGKDDYPDECTPSWSPSCPASTRNNPCGLLVILVSPPSPPYGPLHTAGAGSQPFERCGWPPGVHEGRRDGRVDAPGSVRPHRPPSGRLVLATLHGRRRPHRAIERVHLGHSRDLIRRRRGAHTLAASVLPHPRDSLVTRFSTVRELLLPSTGGPL